MSPTHAGTCRHQPLDVELKGDVENSGASTILARRPPGVLGVRLEALGGSMASRSDPDEALPESSVESSCGCFDSHDADFPESIGFNCVECSENTLSEFADEINLLLPSVCARLF